MISAQLYTVRDLLKNQSKEDIYSVLKSIREMGYEGVQLSGVGQMTEDLAMTYKEVCNGLGLDIVATHFSLEFIEDNLTDIIKWHELWSCKYIGVGSMPENLRNEKGLYEFINRIESLGKKLKEDNLQLIYHNHKFEFEKIGQKTWMEILLEKFSYTDFELDTYWLQAGGVNPVNWINKVKGKMDVVHLKDYKILNDQVEFAEVGLGNLDFEEIIINCKKNKVNHYIVEQDFSENPLNSLKVSFDYLKSFF